MAVNICTPDTARLNDATPGADLTDADTHNLIPMCSFESVSNDALSPFCDLFSEEDFHGYEYEGDLGKFYGTGLVFVYQHPHQNLVDQALK
jgi:hypothetical protein